jgi:DNA-binding NtrC family response regulator
MAKILIVDDDKLAALTLQKMMRSANYDTKLAFSGKEALSLALLYEPDIVLLDYKLPDMNGFEILPKIKKMSTNMEVILITSFCEIPKAVTAIKLGAHDFLTKPFDKEEILRVVSALICSKQKTSFDIPSMMGNSEPLRRVLSDIERICDKDITVFLEGETGTGKELFAHMIHERSPRRKNPFIAVDCGAIPENLFESELFGHTRGAFTGAVAAKKGKFEMANGGTIFLDEINSLPLHLQPKFLRVLQENEIEKLGDEKSTRIDVRIIAASNNNIYLDVQNGLFREDLFYRIHEFKIDLPTLKQRRDDIMIIAECFLREINKEYNRCIDGFSCSAADMMKNYDWPGNIRELKNVIKSAVLLADDMITPEHLSLKNIKRNSENAKDDFILEKLTTKNEEEIIRKALQKTRYNKTETARLLGISRSHLYKKMEEFGLL